MRSFSLQSRQPRRGQALLLAVLIMIFAALLSASFIAIVSVNLNQTARQTDKNRTVVAAGAGMEFVKRQLAYSNQGERWRPSDAGAIPVANDPNYYSPLDRAQGWAADADNDGFGDYAKFPDPRSETGLNPGPQYLARVEKVLPTGPDADKVGALKIIVIGLSPDDPTAYTRSVAYFGGYKNSPLAQVGRMVNNWDFKNGVVPAALSADNTATPTTIMVSNANSDFSKLATPFTITISNPRMGIGARGAVVTDAAVGGNPTSFTLTLASGVVVADGERVDLAANLGAPSTINYGNSAVPTPVPVAVNISDTNSDVIITPVGMPTPTPSPNQVDSVRVNGGLLYSGNLSATRLRPLNTSFGVSGVPGTVLVSSVIAVDPTSAINPSSLTINTADTPGTADTLQSSGAGGIFGSANLPNQSQLASDGWNRLLGQSNTTGRNVTNYQPPVIDAGAGVERYRNLTRLSKPYDDNNMMTPALSPAASLYGNGEGIYIDNASDVEKIGTGLGTTRNMTQTELIRMWMSPATATPDNFARLGAAEAANLATKSLEEQHLRGWVGPDEFRGRGVEVELADDKDYDPNTTGIQSGLIITRDPRSDNTAANLGFSTGSDPTNAKAWKDDTGNPVAGTYRKEFQWPTNGVLFAEGNVRIKGLAANAPRSLTVVSMGNIYIENSLGATATGFNRKILLLAKKNVVMNPTRALGRPDAQTTTNTANQTVAVGTGATLNVADGLTFKQGDFVQASTVTLGVEVPSAQGYITAAPTNTSITFTATMGGTVLPNSLVRTPNATAQLVTSTFAMNKPVPVTSITNSNDVIQRRLSLPATANLLNTRLAWNHEAKRVTGLTVGVTNTPMGAFATPVLFSNKGVFTVPATTPALNASATIVDEAEKGIRADYSEPTPGQDTFPGIAASNPSAPDKPTTESDPVTGARDTTRSLASIAAAMVATDHVDPGPTVRSWKFDTSFPAPYATLPFFYLSGVGNRLDYPLVTTTPRIGTGAERRPDIRTDKYEIPLATSISIFSNGVRTPVTNENWNAALMTPAYDTANQFGFSPTYIDNLVPSEDVLTGDQSFYQNDAIAGTLDSRQISNGLVQATVANPLASNSIVMRRSDDLPLVTAAINLPEYQLEGLKVENVALTASSSNIAAIAPGYEFDVNAYVYAQTGSWFVIPGGFFDDRLKSVTTGTNINVFLDLNDSKDFQAGESIPDGSTGNSYPDLNRNGVIDDAERFAAQRYLRYNYQINFLGAIAENQTAVVNNVGTNMTGAVASWMDKWATIDTTATDRNRRIHYVFDPTVALDGFQKDDPLTTNINEADLGFKLPQVPEVYGIS